MEIAVNIVLMTPGNFAHEILGHGIQETDCDGPGKNDKAITNLNPPGFRYSHSDDSLFQNKVTNVTSTGYGKETAEEDDAELSRTIVVDGAEASRAMSFDNSEGDKMSVILGRWDALAPGCIAYFRDAQPAFSQLENHANAIPSAYDAKKN